MSKVICHEINPYLVKVIILGLNLFHGRSILLSTGMSNQVRRGFNIIWSCNNFIGLSNGISLRPNFSPKTFSPSLRVSSEVKFILYNPMTESLSISVRRCY